MIQEERSYTNIQDRNKPNVFVVVFYLIAFWALYWNNIHEMVSDWYNDPNYSHGFLIPFISGYLLWQDRGEISLTEVKPSTWGIVVLILGLIVYLTGNLSGELFTMNFSMLVVLAGAILFTYGSDRFKAVLFPFSYLIFMIPLPYILYDAVAFPLKLLVSKISVDTLTMMGILVLREGNIINLADTTLEVADACSGIRSIISLLAISTILAYMTQKGWIKRIVLTLLAVPIAIVVNSIRVIGTGILAENYGPQVAEGFFHEFAGLLIFGVAIVLLVLSAMIMTIIGGKVE